MSAPSNDNIVNAISITNQTGTITGSNISASTEYYLSASVPISESGWPRYNPAAVYPQANTELSASATVWYLYTTPSFPAPTGTTGYTYPAPPHWEMLFTTDYASTSSFLTNSLHSVVQIYTMSGSASIQGLNEVSYLTDERVGTNFGAGNSALCSCLMNTGSQYYIRIGGRNNTQGNFTLGWKPFFKPNLGGCSSCPPSSYGTQIATCSVQQVYNSGSNYTQSTYPVYLNCGLYEAKWCKGQYIFNHTNMTNELIYCVAASTAVDVRFSWPVSGSQFSASFGNIYNPAALYATSYATPQEAAYNSTCWSTGMFTVYQNGWLTMSYFDTFASDNINAQYGANPTFEVLAHSSLQGASSSIFPVNAGSSLTGTNPNWTGSFKYTNNMPYPIYNVTASLLNIDGISNASSPIIGNLTPGTNTFTYHFNANIQTSFCTAEIQLSVCSGLNLINLTWPLYPIITYSPSTLFTNGTCSPYVFARQDFQVINAGFVTSAQMGSPSLTITATSFPESLGNWHTCVLIPNVVITGYGIGSVVAGELYCIQPVSAVTNSFTFVSQFGSLTYPPYTFQNIVP